jgi:hypothetical protein
MSPFDPLLPAGGHIRWLPTRLRHPTDARLWQAAGLMKIKLSAALVG